MTTVIEAVTILAAIALPCVFACGFLLGHVVGKMDGYAKAEEQLRRRCAR